MTIELLYCNWPSHSSILPLLRSKHIFKLVCIFPSQLQTKPNKWKLMKSASETLRTSRLEEDVRRNISEIRRVKIVSVCIMRWSLTDTYFVILTCADHTTIQEMCEVLIFAYQKLYASTESSLVLLIIVLYSLAFNIPQSGDFVFALAFLKTRLCIFTVSQSEVIWCPSFPDIICCCETTSRWPTSRLGCLLVLLVLLVCSGTMET